MEYFERRLEILRAEYPDSVILFRDNISRIYLTGFRSSDDADGILAVFPDEAQFYIDSRYTEDAEGSVRSADVILAKSYKEVYVRIFEAASQKGLKTFIFDGTKTDYETFRILKKIRGGLKMRSVPGILSEQRAVKTEREIALISKAVEISEKALSETLPLIKPGVSEKDIQTELEYRIKMNGGTGPSFETILLFGPRSSLPHGVPSHQVKCKDKDIVLIDYGVSYENYISDITRTFFVGTPSDRMKQVYLTVLRANQKVLEKSREGMMIKRVDALARKEIEKAGYGDKFIHSLGHGIGLEVHEAPLVSFKALRGRLKVNNVFTDEPGIYLPGEFGVRIEDDILITETGAVNLSSGISKELTVL